VLAVAVVVMVFSFGKSSKVRCHTVLTIQLCRL